MGGILHLITFESQEDKQTMLDSKWLDRWFLDFQKVDNDNASVWKEAWMSVYGVPLGAWVYENFYNIGCVFGGSRY